MIYIRPWRGAGRKQGVPTGMTVYVQIAIFQAIDSLSSLQISDEGCVDITHQRAPQAVTSCHDNELRVLRVTATS